MKSPLSNQINLENYVKIIINPYGVAYYVQTLSWALYKY